MKSGTKQAKQADLRSLTQGEAVARAVILRYGVRVHDWPGGCAMMFDPRRPQEEKIKKRMPRRSRQLPAPNLVLPACRPRPRPISRPYLLAAHASLRLNHHAGRPIRRPRTCVGTSRNQNNHPAGSFSVHPPNTRPFARPFARQALAYTSTQHHRLLPPTRFPLVLRPLLALWLYPLAAASSFLRLLVPGHGCLSSITGA